MRIGTILALLLGSLPSAPADTVAEGDPFRYGAGTVVIFCCDFTHHPPLANAEISQEACAHTITFDEHPHLCFLAAGRSRFSMEFLLPEAPRAGVLEVVHLASLGEDGKTESPISIIANGKPVVQDWNVGKKEFTETRWSLDQKLRSGPNRIEFRAGNLRTHYWLRRVRVCACFDREVTVTFAVPHVEHALFLEGRFSQCSYNALATVLDHFYGVEAWTSETQDFEKRTFVAALRKSGLEAYYGWAPWTSYMVQSGTIQWNGHTVDDLKAERFALKTKEIPRPQGKEMIVRYQPGERASLCSELLSRLQKGPVIIWTPYAAALDKPDKAWQHVRAADTNTDAVAFRPGMTHSVVVNLEGVRVKIYDNSSPNGVWVVDPEIVVATAAAMLGSVQIDRGGGKTIYAGLHGKGLEGAEDDAYNVVFWKDR
jgi:hypothetical protein